MMWLRSSGRLALIVLGLLLGWQVVAESLEPFWILSARQLILPESPAIEIEGPAQTTLRLYRGASPHIGKIARLQKGLVWAHRGRELVEEAYGFGCPIVLVGGQAYNSRKAEVSWQAYDNRWVLRKRFVMDTIDTPIELMRRKYRSVPDIGAVTCNYTIHPQGIIDVAVDLRELDLGWTQLYMMNEQGARAFTLYRDSEGRELRAPAIHKWFPVQTRRACFARSDDAFAFCVETPPEHMLYVGRERYCQYHWRGLYCLSWSGVDLEVQGPTQEISYRIVLETP
jgi:hypothetical protein